MDLDLDQHAFVDAAKQPLGDDPARRERLEEGVAVAARIARRGAGTRPHRDESRPPLHAPGMVWQLDIDEPGPGKSIVTSRLEIEYAGWLRAETLRHLDEAK